MAIPDFQTLMLPVLQAAAATPITTAELVATMADRFHLTEEERNQLLPRGRQATIANRTHWALAYLTRAGLLNRVSRGNYVTSDKGRSVVASPPERITIPFLRQFPEFRTLRPDDPIPDGPASIVADPPVATEATSTPDEQITAAVAAIEADRRAEILQRLLDAPPAFFE